MLKIGSKIFDGIFSENNRKKIESFTIWSASIGFIFHLSLVLLNNNSIINIGNESLLLTNPISAIYTPFSIILYYEIFLLIFYLPRSFTTSILKQFEIISLIVIRRIFYDIPKLDLGSNNWFENADNLQITYDLICILILFFLIYLFNYVKTNIVVKKGKNIDNNILRKELKEHELFYCEKIKVLITHIAGKTPNYNKKTRELIKLEKPKILVCGHSHILKVNFDKKNDLLCINPGAAGRHGFHKKRTIVRFEIIEDNIQKMEIIELGDRSVLSNPVGRANY